ncbi:hypothetical protein Syun_016537 [Stephania yunnanensis]|uniref:Uncharacterized protein n=1 Tax=Stephania yunnanensis TaxID=152371 RepID=A0AAP0J6W1_9MAGN
MLDNIKRMEKVKVRNIRERLIREMNEYSNWPPKDKSYEMVYLKNSRILKFAQRR